MAATRDDIQRWFDEGVQKGATHMIVACDTFDWEDYPVFVMPETDPREEAAKYDGPNMQKLMEVYNLALDRDPQLNRRRCFEY